VKHGEGRSAKALHRLRPELFEHPQISERFPQFARAITNVSLPLAGEDIYVSSKDVRDYGTELKEFWSQLSNAIEHVGEASGARGL
jgi:hypothetical protein